MRLRYTMNLCCLSDEVKTLMFFEGCLPQLGCSIKLRGAPEYELARVKEIIMLMMCVAYHSQLEISFLMDEFAMPPSLAQSTSFPCLLDGAFASEESDGEGRGMEANGESQETNTVTGDTVLADGEDGLSSETSSKKGEADGSRYKLSSLSSVQEETENPETMTSSPFSTPASLSVSPPFLLKEDQVMISDTAFSASEGIMGEDGDPAEEHCMENGEGSEMPTTRLFCDPLQDDTGMFVTEQVASSDDRLKSISAAFKQELKDIILCISPFITFKEPFLLTPAGMHCPSRDYFPEQVHRFVVVAFIFKDQLIKSAMSRVRSWKLVV